MQRSELGCMKFVFSRTSCVRPMKQINMKQIKGYHMPHRSVERSATFLILALTAVIGLGCTASDPAPKVAASSGVPSAPAAFEAEGILDEKELVLVKPMIESDASMYFRAKKAGVSPSTLNPKAYGIEIYAMRKNPIVGTAFLHHTRVYSLDSMPRRLIFDEQYFYCNGFISKEVIKVSEKGWSEYYQASEKDIEKLATLSEAVRNGTSHREAYKALGPFGDLSKSGGEQLNLFEREVTWLVGKQTLDGVSVEVLPSTEFGNTIATRFVQ